MPAIKKQGKFKKIIGFFNPSTKRGSKMLLALCFVLIFGGIGVWKLFFSKAAPVIAGNVLIHNLSEYSQTNKASGSQLVYGKDNYYRTNHNLIYNYDDLGSCYENSASYSKSGKMLAVICSKGDDLGKSIAIFGANGIFINKIDIPGTGYIDNSKNMWINNDSSLVFVTNVSTVSTYGFYELYKVDVSGNNLTKISPEGLSVFRFFAYDANKLIYEGGYPVGDNGGELKDYGTFITNINFENPIKINVNGANLGNITAAFSNDGAKIAIASNYNDNSTSIYLLDSSGTYQKTLAFIGNDKYVTNIKWSNDDKHVLFDRTICSWDTWKNTLDKPDYDLGFECPSTDIFALDTTYTDPTVYPYIKSALLIDVQPLGKTTKKVLNDYNGDGKSDIGLFRNGQLVTSLTQYPFPNPSGADSTTKWALGDFDGNGITSFGYINKSRSHSKVNAVPNLRPYVDSIDSKHDVMVGDFDGDKIDDIAVFDRSSTDGKAYFEVRYFDKPWSKIQYGLNTDIPVPADYNGDGTTDMALFRPSTGKWYVRGITSFIYGKKGDIPVPADYNGDGKADAAVFRPFVSGVSDTGKWLAKGVSEMIVTNKAGDIPVPGDYNGDGKADMALYRPSTFTWYTRSIGKIILGQSGDRPVNLPHAVYSRFFK